VVAVAEGGPVSLLSDGRSGLLRAPDPVALADALLELAGSPTLRAKLAGGGLAAVRERSWDAALGRLADGYRGVLGIQRSESVSVAGRRTGAPAVRRPRPRQVA
jgi:glycosyltransferase involved in cell wall biosynthesis